MLGHRPRSSIDDPKYISGWVTACYNTTAVCLIAVPAAFILGFCATSWYCVTYRKTFVATAAIFLTFLGLWVGMIAFARWDPNEVLYWFMD